MESGGTKKEDSVWKEVESRSGEWLHHSALDPCTLTRPNCRRQFRLAVMGDVIRFSLTAEGCYRVGKRQKREKWKRERGVRERERNRDEGSQKRAISSKVRKVKSKVREGSSFHIRT